MFGHVRLFLLLSVLFWTALGGAVSAQGNSATQPDFAQWQTLADRAKNAIDAARASDAAFEMIRSELVSSRQQFLAASGLNSERIETLQLQINALGPPPENAQEAPEIATRRAELNQQLQKVRAPVVAAEEAYNLADGLIREIDRILAERRAANLLSRNDTPLNPALWFDAVSSLGETVASMVSEVKTPWASDRYRADLRKNLPVVLTLFFIGLVLLLRGRKWSVAAGNYFRRFGGAGTGTWSFLVSLGRIIIPIIGVVFISGAIISTGVVGPRVSKLVESLPEWAMVLLMLRWLCEQLFSKRDEDALFAFAQERRAELRFYGSLLSVLYVGNDILHQLMDLENASANEQAVVAFPILVVAAIILFRLGQILVKAIHVPNDADEDQTQKSGVALFLKIAGQISIVVAVTTPFIAGLGYTNLAASILYPTIKSLTVIGLAAVLHRFLADVYCWLSGRGEEGKDSLVPVLIAFALSIVILVPLALIWGARPSEILELWKLFNNGFSLGDTRVSPSDFLIFAVIFAALYMLTRLFQNALKTSLLPKTHLDVGAQNAVVSGVGYLGIFFAALIAITSAGIDLSGFAIVAGALSVGVGFGLQTIVQNFVSGIILLIERPIAEGDWIEVNGSMGYVRDISVRSTRIETFDRTDVIIPNADFISGTVTNYTRGNTIGRLIAPVGVAYGTDTRRVETILREIAEAHPMVLANPPPNIVFQGFGADSLDFEIRAILRDVNWVLSVKSDINHEIAKRFAAEGIEIPFAQRDIWLRNPEALRPTSDDGADT